MAAIVTYGVAKRFGSTHVLYNLNLQVQAGTIFALLGDNGSGKSTLLHLLSGLLKADAGTLCIHGLDPERHADKVRRLLTYVPQSPTSDPDLTAAENLDFFAALYGIPRNERPMVIQEALTAIGLLHKRDVPTRTFSGGMRRRLELARCLLLKPKVVLLDEPSAALDPATRCLFQRLVRMFAREWGATVMLATQYPEEAADLADGCGVLCHGQIVVQRVHPGEALSLPARATPAGRVQS